MREALVVRSVLSTAGWACVKVRALTRLYKEPFRGGLSVLKPCLNRAHVVPYVIVD